MTETLAKRIQRWTSEDTPLARQVMQASNLVRYLEKSHFSTYVPTESGHPPFWARLQKWLDQVPESEQRHLLCALTRLFFVGIQEQNALLLAAMSGPVQRWLIEYGDID